MRKTRACHSRVGEHAELIFVDKMSHAGEERQGSVMRQRPREFRIRNWIARSRLGPHLLIPERIDRSICQIAAKLQIATFRCDLERAVSRTGCASGEPQSTA